MVILLTKSMVMIASEFLGRVVLLVVVLVLLLVRL